MNREPSLGRPGTFPMATASQDPGPLTSVSSTAKPASTGKPASTTQPSPLLGQESGMPSKTATRDGGPVDGRPAPPSQSASRQAGRRPQRPSLGGGLPARQRELG